MTSPKPSDGKVFSMCIERERSSESASGFIQILVPSHIPRNWFLSNPVVYNLTKHVVQYQQEEKAGDSSSSC